MKKGKLWLRSLLTTALGVSVFMSSLGTVPAVSAAEETEEVVVEVSEDV